MKAEVWISLLFFCICSVSAAQVLPDFQVNEDAGVASKRYASVAVSDSGDFVIVWEDDRDGDPAVYYQCFHADGTAKGTNRRVKVENADQQKPHIAMDSRGRFVITWQHLWWYQNIFCQYFDENGNPVGTTTKVVDDILGRWAVGSAKAAMADNGTCLIVWEDNRNGSFRTACQLYDSTGKAIGKNITFAGMGTNQIHPTADIASDGRFVVAWEAESNGKRDIYLQRFNRDKSLSGSPQKINDDSGDKDQRYPILRFANNDTFIVAWEDDRDGECNIYFQYMSMDGSLIGTNTLVQNNYANTSNIWPSLTVTKGKKTVLAFYNQSGNGARICAYILNSEGSTQGTNIELYKTDQYLWDYSAVPSVDASVHGDIVVSWAHEYLCKVLFRKIDDAGITIADTMVASNDQFSSKQSMPEVAMNSTDHYAISWLDMRNGDTDLYIRFFNSENLPPKGDTRVEDITQSCTQTMQAICASESQYLVTWQDDRIGYFNIYAQIYSTEGEPAGNNYKINLNRGSSVHSLHPATDDLPGGDFIIAWQSGDYPNSDIYCRRVASDGKTLGPELKLNDYAGKKATYPKIAAAKNGKAMVIWEDQRVGNNNIYGQIIDENGALSGSNFRVTDSNSNPYCKIIADTSGNFLIAWFHTDATIRMQRYTNAGTRIGTNTTVIDNTNGKMQAALAVDEASNYVLAWVDDGRSNLEVRNLDITLQRFSKNLTKIGPQTNLINDGGRWLCEEPDLAMSANKILTVWQDNRRPGYGFDIYARLDLFSLIPAPLPNQSDVHTDANIESQFGFDVAPNTLSNTSISAQGSHSGKSSSTSIGYSDKKLTFDPTEDFLPGETVNAALSNAIKSLDGSPGPGAYCWQFNIAPEYGSGQFRKTDALLFPKTNRCYWGDFNKDHKIDLLVTGNDSSYLRLHGANNAFSTQKEIFTSSGLTDLFSADLDLDGDLDLICAYAAANHLTLFMNDGNGNFFNGGDITCISPQSITAGNFNSDGFFDLAVVNSAISTVSVFLNNKNGTFANAVTYTVTASPSIIRNADVNNDGAIDLIVGSAASAAISVLTGNNDGTFNSKKDYPMAASAGEIQLVTTDLTGDRYIDCAIIDRTASSLIIINNDGFGRFNLKAAYSTGSEPVSLSQADFDFDGDIDIAVANAASKTISIHLNDASGHFPQKRNITLDNAPNWVISGDFDLDGDIDLGVSCPEINQIHLLQNLNYEAKFVCNTKSLNFGMQKVGVGKSLQFSVKNGGLDSVLIISNIAASDPAFQVEPQTSRIAAGDSLIFTATFIPANLSNYKATAVLYCNDVRQPQFTIPLTGEGVDAPIAATLSATSISANSAILNGKVNANGLATTVQFQWGLTTSYGNWVEAIPITVLGKNEVYVTATVSGLIPNTEYFFRVVAANSAGESSGNRQSFIATAKGPTAITTEATDININSVVLNGTVNPKSQQTIVYFAYGITQAYGDTVYASQSPINGALDLSVSATVQGLQINTTYHFIIVAKNGSGATVGADRTFTTSSPAPLVTTGMAANVSMTSATLNGVVNPKGRSSLVRFQYGVSTSYGMEATADQSPVTGINDVNVSAQLTNLRRNTLYHYRVLCGNEADTSYGADVTFVTLADMTPPTITHAAVTTATSGTPLVISADLFDNLGIFQAWLYYRKGGAMRYDSTSMTRISGLNYEGTIPSAGVTERGMEYYIAIIDSFANKATYPAAEAAQKPRMVQVVNNNVSFGSSTVAGAYRMLSVPFDLDSSSPDNVLVDDLGSYHKPSWRLFRYINGADMEYGTEGFPNLRPGIGFWLITKEVKALDAGSGKSLPTAENYRITLQPGWNQIGNPFAFAVNWSDVVRPAEVESRLVGYGGTSNDATGYDYSRSRLEPWEGYFVNNAGSTTAIVEIPPRAAMSLAKAGTSLLTERVMQKGEWWIQLTVQSGRYIDRDNYLGCLLDAREGYDRNDFAEAPLFMEGVSLNFPHTDWPDRPNFYSGDFRGVQIEGAIWDFEVQVNLEPGAVHLMLGERSPLPEGWQMMLLDKTSKAALPIKDLFSYTYANPIDPSAVNRAFRLLAGPSSYISENNSGYALLPDQFSLSQNFPNPFNSSTCIRYSVPSSSTLLLAVYNLKGEVVKLLYSGMHDAGTFDIQWDGTDGNGMTAASGLYVIRLHSESFEAAQKIILAR